MRHKSKIKVRDCLERVFSATAGKGVCRQPWWAPKNRARIVGRCTACRWALIHCRALQFIIPVLVCPGIIAPSLSFSAQAARTQW